MAPSSPTLGNNALLLLSILVILGVAEKYAGPFGAWATYLIYALLVIGTLVSAAGVRQKAPKAGLALMLFAALDAMALYLVVFRSS